MNKCIKQGLMHVAAWYPGTPDQSSRHSGSVNWSDL